MEKVCFRVNANAINILVAICKSLKVRMTNEWSLTLATPKSSFPASIIIKDPLKGDVNVERRKRKWMRWRKHGPKRLHAENMHVYKKNYHRRRKRSCFQMKLTLNILEDFRSSEINKVVCLNISKGLKSTSAGLCSFVFLIL